MSVPVEALYPDLMKMTLKESHCDTGSTWSPGQREDIQRIERGQREDRERSRGQREDRERMRGQREAREKIGRTEKEQEGQRKQIGPRGQGKHRDGTVRGQRENRKDREGREDS